ncbi:MULTISPECIES: LLM class flavin-dependent oxidoreductase [Burkholderia]|jgi:alkanesulfonate monooxygenase|nr:MULTISPECIES: LLM class flavin-dependent oxidoreductase [Burkholderia]KKL42276.1 alkanesulfonate monooxygenase [Burkholderia contaminans LMG 23361]MBA9828970.1 LLM class flavin-dependent oxidoreductase [Burkholderia contaminans]MBA9838132.1 LLM class flavin-dependent oxidoreductase [Burkholderia contaminans]MBA9862389.1 LLM class flavin-dependent oxidoreductase [Burkholderia contaminans]MBA9907424.1 LLM class flavin-dependent oxidoreductase [Burkholderia contaminans]
MSVDFAWFLPTNGDGPHLANSGLPRPPTFMQDYRPATPEYLRGVARAAEAAGFDSLLLPMAAGFEDPWLVSAQLVRATRRIALIVTFRPGLEQPEQIARRAATLQHMSGARLRLFAVNGSSAYEQRALGDFLDHDARYQRTSEYLRVLRRLWQGGGHSVAGRYYMLSPAHAGVPLATPPALYLGGASTLAEQVAASQADTYLLWGEPPDAVRERLARLRALAAMHGRRLRFGLRVHVIARATERAAWARADELLSEISDQTYVDAQRKLAAYESVGQQRQTALSRGALRSLRELEVYPNLWAGVGLIRGGAGTAIVGSYDQVAARIHEYRALGIETFLLSSYPNLEEAARVGEDVLPRVRTRLARASLP